MIFVEAKLKKNYYEVLSKETRLESDFTFPLELLQQQ